MASTIDITQPVASSSLASSVIRANFAAAATDITALQTSAPQTMTTTSDVTFRDITFRHLIGTSTLGTCTAGTGAGTSPTVTHTGNDAAIHLSVVTGTSCAGSNATIVTGSFSATYGASTTPTLVISPANAAAAALTGTTQVYITNGSGGGTPSQYRVISGSSALTDSTTYLFNIIVVR